MSSGKNTVNFPARVYKKHYNPISFQIKNLKAFCKLAEKKCPKLELISVRSKLLPSEERVSDELGDLITNMLRGGIHVIIYLDAIHDREIM